MLPDRVSNPGPLNYESGALPIALHGPANSFIRALSLNDYEDLKSVLFHESLEFLNCTHLL